MFASISPLLGTAAAAYGVLAGLSLRGSLVHPASSVSRTAVPVAQGHLAEPHTHTTAPVGRPAPGAPPRTPA